jgi:hypothetical protein
LISGKRLNLRNGIAEQLRKSQSSQNIERGMSLTHFIGNERKSRHQEKLIEMENTSINFQ